MLASAARSLRGRLGRAVKALPPLVPPLEFPCRIETLPEGCADLDNDIYRDADLVRSWHADDRSRELATLHLLNSARIPYFDRIWSQQLVLTPERPGNFLEVGCGGGVATCELARLGYSMTGIDPAEESLEAARAHARSLGLQSSTLFATGSAYDLECFPPESFDGVVLADVLEHLYDLPAAVEQVWRVLRPGGVFVFDTINRTYASYLLAIVVAQELGRMVPARTHDWRMFIKPHELSFLLQSHGFLVDSAQFRGMAPTLAPDPRALAAQARAVPRAEPRRPSPSSRVCSACRLPQLTRRAGAPSWPPPLPLSDFIEVSSLEVQYMGWAAKPRSASERRPLQEEAGALARGLREFRRSTQ